jgi:EAL and modified HD-GYP domain-containing signal transduction protein
MSRFMVGRQPIFDSKLRVHGYELLFRDPGLAPPDGDAMTADVLVRSGLDIGLGGLVGTKPAFVNATRSFLVGDRELPFSPDEVVIEVLEHVPRDAEVVAGCQRLMQSGCTLALDDYVWEGNQDPLLELASIIKLDVLALTASELAEAARNCLMFEVQLVAERWRPESSSRPATSSPSSCSRATCWLVPRRSKARRCRRAASLACACSTSSVTPAHQLVTSSR